VGSTCGSVVAIDRGVETSLPFLRDKFMGPSGAAGACIWAHRLTLTYDAHNGRDTPTRGYYGQIFAEAAAPALGSHATFVRYGLEGRLLGPLFEERLVTVMRLVAATQVVAKVDVGLGSEGIAIFAGLNYPF
jgi:hypothetical protein